LPEHPFLDRAGCWFLYSGIQEPSGGVARYYRADAASNLGVSTEITGYAVSTLCYLYSVTGRREYLENAEAAGAFLCNAWDPATRTMPFEHGTANYLTYFFDCGIIVRGLLRLYRIGRQDLWLECATNVAESMRSHFHNNSGGYHPVLQLPSKQPLPPDERWSRNPGCYQLKSAMAWLELVEVTGETDWRTLYEHVLRFSLAAHAGFPTLEHQRERIMDRLHAYCYFLEGLLPSAGRPECREALARGIETTARHLRDIAPEFARSDVYAQLLRIRLYADALGAVPLDHPAAEQESLCLATFQVDHADGRQRGGFCFGKKGGTPLPFSNPVSTGFGVQALHLWHEYAAGHPPGDIEALI
jgi:hypothetical protein